MGCGGLDAVGEAKVMAVSRSERMLVRRGTEERRSWEGTRRRRACERLL